MAKDKYVSMKKFVSGFSFANLGIFTGAGNGIYNAVYALVLLDIFRNSAIIGIYVSIYSAFCILISLFATELFRYFSKAKIFYFAMLMLAVCYFMMGFSVKSGTFIALDYASGFAIVLVAVLIPLFMADFAKNIGMAKLNARYYLWLNIGALFAPMVAMFIAGSFGNRPAFFGAAMAYALGFWAFKYFKIVQEDKKTRTVSPRKTVKALWRNTISFFQRPGMLRAYAVNFGYYSLSAMRVLYVPIMVIESGFSKETLGMVLTLGIVPYIISSVFMGQLVQRFGNKLWLTIGFLSFAGFSIAAVFAEGWALLSIFILWQISGALMESVHDLLFFDATKKTDQAKYYGVFRTSGNLPSFIVPMLGAVCIAIFGGTYAVWLVTAVIGVGATLVLWSKK